METVMAKRKRLDIKVHGEYGTLETTLQERADDVQRYEKEIVKDALFLYNREQDDNVRDTKMKTILVSSISVFAILTTLYYIV